MNGPRARVANENQIRVQIPAATPAKRSENVLFGVTISLILAFIIAAFTSAPLCTRLHQPL
jgi:hypothetical protein